MMKNKNIVILANLVVSLSLFITGFVRLMLRDPVSGVGYEWSAAMVIVGLMTLFLIPLEICVMKTQGATRQRQSRLARGISGIRNVS